MDKIDNNYGWVIYKNYVDESFIVKQNLLPKFKKDKINIDDEKCTIIIDGVIFNKLELMDKYKLQEWEECVLFLFNERKNFYDCFRGSFNGIVIDKQDGQVFVFTDQLGDRPVFYYTTPEFFVASSNFNQLRGVLYDNGIQYELNTVAVKYMLSFGGMLDDSTYISGVYRLLGGWHLKIGSGGFELSKSQYFVFDNTKPKIEDEETAIQLLDESFRKAVQRQFGKDAEYGYVSLVDISGGMDSRTVNYVAKAMGYKDILNICMSQMNADERRVAEQNVKLLENDYVFTALDNGSFIYDIDDIVKINYGLVYAGSVTGGLKNTRLLNMDNIGLHHTGILGDVHDGSFVPETCQTPPDLLNSKYFMSKTNIFDFSEFCISDYQNQEMLLFLTRGVLFGFTSNFIRQSVTESYSPFADVDFLKVFFDIPLELRTKGKILQKWVLEKYPDVNKTVYSNTSAKLTVNIYVRKIKSLIRRLWRDVIKKGLYRLHFPIDISPKNSMNPFDYWYNTIPDFKNYIDHYCKEGLETLEEYPKVKSWCDNCCRSGLVIDKLLAMTVMSAVKQYFN